MLASIAGCFDFGVAGKVVGDAVERVGRVALPGVVGRRAGRGHVRPERPGSAVDRRVNVVRRNARRGRAAIGAGDRHGEDEAGLARGNALTVLVGGVVSISHEVESELVPALPLVSWMPVALTVSV